MSCYEIVDASGTITRHCTGDVTVILTSANTGAGYTPPACSKEVSSGVPEPGTLALLGVAVVALALQRAHRATTASRATNGPPRTPTTIA